MTWLKLATRKATLAGILLLALTHLLVCRTPSHAQSQRKSGFVETIIRFFLGTRPGGTPTGRQRGGAVRDRCPNVAEPLTALVPATPEGFPFIEQTIAERPTFWFYIPYLPVSQLNAEFVLINEKEDDVYSATFPLRQQPGIVSLQLPKTMPPIKEGNKYRWIFSVICNPQNLSGNATVNGWVERVPVSPTLSSKLKAASAKERVSVYADARLWYETLTTLAELRRTNPQDKEVKADWAEILQAVGSSRSVSQTWTTYSLPNQANNRRGN